MRIVICDDMTDQLGRIVELVGAYIQSNHIDAEIKTFSHPDMLLQYCEMNQSQLYILDVVMPMMNGIQLGQEIRLLDKQAQMIFVTTAPEYALDSFSVNPLNYLIKPVDKDKLFQALSLTMNRIMSDEQSITIKTKNGLYTISFSSILLCEYVNHTVRYVLTSGENIKTTTIKGSFTKHIAPLLEDKKFIQPHASFVINMSRVERLSRDGIMMRGGEFVPVSGKLFSEVKKMYIEFRLKDGVSI
jgi:DNA-binding LytR/AlgR family response regulator